MKEKLEKKEETWEWVQILKYLHGGYQVSIRLDHDTPVIQFMKPGHNFTLDTIQR